MYTTIIHSIRKKHGITMQDYCVCDMVSKQVQKLGYKFLKDVIAQKLLLSKGQVEGAIKRLHKKDLVEHGPTRGTIVTSARWNNEFSLTVEHVSIEKPVKKKEKPKQTIKERSELFKLKVFNDHKSKYSNALLKKFCDVWTEHGENDQLMRFEKQESFDIGRRLTRFKINESKWEKNNVQESEQTKVLKGTWGK